ncbi:hypothetical protein CDAR_29061 [Caerostris darwini]|uniref:Transposase n=1 Tax=Caerostris darwini TaxID=1538125 RepID=A0AAV4N957_9ARAC|nr:hypothetical protein CDAR_29061 [Caerostris darwini]
MFQENIREPRRNMIVPHRKPYINKANRKARLAFSKMYIKQPTEFGEMSFLGIKTNIKFPDRMTRKKGLTHIKYSIGYQTFSSYCKIWRLQPIWSGVAWQTLVQDILYQNLEQIVSNFGNLKAF